MNTLSGSRRVAACLIAACAALSATLATAPGASASTTAAHCLRCTGRVSSAHASSPVLREPSLAQIAMLKERARLAARAEPSGTGAITGVVAGFDGQLVAGACVTAVGQAGSMTAAAAPDGTFRLAGLTAGSYTLEYRDCAAPGRYLTTWSGAAADRATAAHVQVADGEVRHVPVMMLRPANPEAALADGQASFQRALVASEPQL